MDLNIVTLILVVSLILGTQVIALFVQHRLNRNYKGIGYWTLGSAFMALGFILMPLVLLEKWKMFAMLANPIFFLGHIYLYIGIKSFYNKIINKWTPISIFSIFNLLYFYNIFINNNVIARTIVISGAITIISYMMVYEVYLEKDKRVSIIEKYTSSIFFAYGSFYLMRIFLVAILPSGQSYADKGSTIISSAIISIIITNLWTFGLIIMVNQRLNSDNKLEKEKLQTMFNTSIDGQLITRLEDGLIIDVNNEFPILSGYSKKELIGSSIINNELWFNPVDRVNFIVELNEKGFCKSMEAIFQRKEGSLFPGIISARIIIIRDVTHIISVVRDISERKKFEKEIIESEAKYRSIINASPDNITITDLEGKILMISPVAKKMFGYEQDYENFMDMDLFDFIVDEDVEKAKANIVKMYEGSTRSTTEYIGIRKDKTSFDIEVNSGFINNAEGIPDKMVFIVRDISERKLVDHQMKELVKQLEIERNTAQLNAITDSLTGLYNRGYFDKTMRAEFSRLNRSGSMMSLIMLDIDHFKKFNDSYGHLAGDKCIQMITTMLNNSVGRPSDIAARYGGEEFIVILPETDENGAKMLGERIRKGVEDLKIPHITSDTAKFVTVSVGIVTVYPARLVSPDQALKLVDDALYSAKDQGRNRCVYSSSLTEL